DKLRINFEAAGSLRVLVIDESGKTVAESEPATRDAVAQEGRRAGGAGPPALRGKAGPPPLRAPEREALRVRVRALIRKPKIENRKSETIEPPRPPPKGDEDPALTNLPVAAR